MTTLQYRQIANTVLRCVPVRKNISSGKSQHMPLIIAAQLIDSFFIVTTSRTLKCIDFGMDLCMVYQVRYARPKNFVGDPQRSS